MSYTDYDFALSTAYNDRTALHSAVCQGREDFVEVLLSRPHIDVDHKVGNGETALLCAVKIGHSNIIQALVKNGADVNLKDHLGMSALHHAAVTKACGRRFSLKCLLTKNANVNAFDRNYKTPLHLAIENDNESCIQDLLDYGVDINVKDQVGQTPLHLAACKSSSSIISLLLPHRPSINVKEGKGKTPLDIAIELGSEDSVVALINQGADVNLQDKLGETPLHRAVSRGRVHSVIALLDRGSAVDAKNIIGKTPLDIAFDKLEPERLVLALLKHGADVNRRDRSGKAPLHYAARKGLKEAVSSLLDRGADVNVVDREGKSPLQIAFEQGSERIVTDIISHRADINFKDDCGRTPLHYAAEKGMPYAVTELLERGAIVDSRDVKGRTPLHMLSAGSGGERPADDGAYLWDAYGGKLLNVENGHCVITSILLKHVADHGVSVNCRDNSGKTALYVAAETGRVDAVRALLKYGADVNIQPKVSPNFTPLKWAKAASTSCEVVDALQKHIITLRSLNFPIHELNLNSIDFDSEAVKSHQESCDKDLQSLKNAWLRRENQRVSLYDLLTDHQFSSGIVLNVGSSSFSEILSTVGAAYSRTVSPIVGNLLALKMCWIYERTERKILLERACDILGERFAVPPGDCTDALCFYLSNKDLKNFVAACQCTMDS